ncbi:MAG: hypothetical protein JSV49_01510, partial [Thermoplasmata archaeon]
EFRAGNDAMNPAASADDLSRYPNINRIASSIVLEDDKIFVMMVVSGWIMEGDSDTRADQVHIFIDSDVDGSTGYLYSGLGADYMIHAYGKNGKIHYGGVYLFDPDYKSEEKRINTDWNAWNLMGNGMIDNSRNKLEACVYLIDGTYNPGGTTLAVFKTTDYAGNSDRTAIISDKSGYITLEQEPASNDDVLSSAPGTEVIKITATAHEAPIKLDSFSFKNSDDSNYIITPTLPVTLNAEETMEFVVEVDTSTIPAETVLDFEITKVAASLESQDTNTAVPITLSGSGYKGYVKTAPDEIRIDGAFGDWANIVGFDDEEAENSINGNINIDLREYRTVKATDSLSFYLRVDGEMMKGTKILHGPMSIIEKNIQNSDEEYRSSANDDGELVIQYGYDYAYIMLDIDRDKLSGYSINRQLGADYMIRVVGQDGEIFFNELYCYNQETSMKSSECIENIMKKRNTMEGWVKITDVSAALDLSRLEAQISTKLLNLNHFNDINYYILMTDWTEAKDTIADPGLGEPGEPGVISVIKMDENTIFAEPKQLNSRNPSLTRASSRASLPNGDQNWANLIPANGSTLDGSYYNITTFEVKAGRIVYLNDDPTIYHEYYIKIVANNIYINGTIFGAGNGSTGGAGGGSGNEGEGGEGPNSHAGGGNLGWGPPLIGPSYFGGGGGGGGGAYGGAGGAGGAGGGPNGGGAGGASTTYGSATTKTIKQGSGGGGGGSGQHLNGGAGGNGGSAIWLRAKDNLSIAGEITVNGSDGENAAGGSGGQCTGGGGGGGSGGGILIILDSQTNYLNITGKLYANGGDGGNGGSTSGTDSDSGGGGGGGGGGRIKIFYNSSFLNLSTFEFNGGLAGSAGAAGQNMGSNGSSGSAGTLHVVPEYHIIAIPVSLTLLVIYGLRRNARRGTSARYGKDASTKGVSL